MKCLHGAESYWGNGTTPGWAQPPFIPGHEFLGEVVFVGKNVQGFEVGDRVTPEQIVPCNECRFCKRGQYWMCQPHQMFGYFTEFNGGMAEYVRLPMKRARVHKVPKELPMSAALLIEPFSCAKHCVDRAQIGSEDIVVLSGAGTLGLGMCTYARSRNPYKLIVLDMIDERLEKAKAFGADEAWNPGKEDVIKKIMDLTDGYGCDIYIEATGAPASVRQGMKMIRNTAFSLQGNKASLLGIGFLAALFCIMGTDLLSELFDLPNLMEDQMQGMAGTVMGALAIGVIGPVAEELVFREAILGHLLRRGTSPWLAMVASALLFGLIHLNPAQVPFAAAMGLVLAIVYYRTGNIVLTSIIHIFNNSLAVLEMNLLGDKAKTFTLTNDVLGGQTNAIVCIIVFLIVGIMLLRMFWQKTEVPVWGIKDEA